MHFGHFSKDLAQNQENDQDNKATNKNKGKGKNWKHREFYGVGILIKNELLDYIVDIEQIDGTMMTLSLRCQPRNLNI